MKWYGSRFLLKKAFKINSPVLREPLANNQIFIKKLICYEISGKYTEELFLKDLSTNIT